MKALSLQQVADLSGGRLVCGDPERVVTSVSTDTRSIPEGALFVALVGDRFDAHDFLDKAVEKGVGALLVSKEVGDLRVPVVLVEDTLTGLQQLAKGYRKLLPTKAVVITGSNGKTSTKDMIRSVLESRFSVTATKGNLNNHIGLPLTVLDTEAEDDFGVWEIGMNHHGEIAPLADISAPDIGVITNIGTAHIGNMGSREGIAQEKGMLAEAIGAEGVLLLNANDEFTSSIRKRCSGRVVEAGIDAGDVRAINLRVLETGTAFELQIGSEQAAVCLPIPGQHMVSNALLAASVGHEAGLSLVEIAEALSTVCLTPGRLQTLEHAGVTIINDAYNANPDSMRASLATVSAMKSGGKTFALLGVMGELGEGAEAAHREIGQLAVREGFQYLVSVGRGAQSYTDGLSTTSGCEICHFESREEAADFLKRTTQVGDLVLLKGSRSAGMDSIYKLYATSS